MTWILPEAMRPRSIEQPKEVSPHLLVSRIYVYPVKGCRAVSLEAARYERQGFRYDRKWMVVDEAGRFVSQRHVPKMALLQVAMDHDRGRLRLTVDGGEGETVETPLDPSEEELQDYRPTKTTLWSHQLETLALPERDPAHVLLSRLCGRPVRLVMQWQRRAAGQGVEDKEHATLKLGYSSGAEARLHDLYPFLLASERSIEAVNERLGRDDLDILRFRPNIVVSGLDEAWSEDAWRRIEVAGQLIWIVALCKRCMVPNIDPATGHQDPSIPSKDMASYRRIDPGMKYKVCFGVNGIPDSADGRIAVGDRVKVIEAWR